MSRIDEIRERLAKATPGPWFAAISEDATTGKSATVVVDAEQASKIGLKHLGITTIANCGPEDEASAQDALLIANAPDDITYLLDMLEWKDAPTEPGLWFHETKQGEITHRGWSQLDERGVEIMAQKSGIRWFRIPADQGEPR